MKSKLFAPKVEDHEKNTISSCVSEFYDVSYLVAFWLTVFPLSGT